MPVPRVIHALAEKRAYLVAELAHPEGRHDYCRAGIAALDAALALWDCEPPQLKRRYIPKPALVPKLVRRITNALRDAGEPLTTRQIVEAVSVGMELDESLRLDLTRTIGWRLRDMRREKRVKAEKVDRINRWEITES